RPFAFRSDSYTGGFSFGPFTADYRHDQREAFVDGTSYTSREESGRAIIGHSLGRATLSTSAELGRADDALSGGVPKPFRRFSGSIFLSGSSRWSGGTSLE